MPRGKIITDDIKKKVMDYFFVAEDKRLSSIAAKFGISKNAVFLITDEYFNKKIAKHHVKTVSERVN